MTGSRVVFAPHEPAHRAALREPARIRRWRRRVERHGTLFRTITGSWVVTEPEIARTALSYKVTGLQSYGLLGPMAPELPLVRRALRRWASEFEAAMSVEEFVRCLDDVVRACRPGPVTVEAVVRGVVAFMVPELFGGSCSLLERASQEFVMSRLHAGDRSPLAAVRRRRARDRMTAVVTALQEGRLTARADWRPLQGRLSGRQAIEDEIGARPTDSVTHFLIGTLLASTGTPGTASAWALAECDRDRGLLGPHLSDLQGTAAGEEAVARELLRLRPPAWLEMRKVAEPTTLGSQRVGPHDRLIVPVLLVQTNPSAWPDPYDCLPWRWSDAPTPVAYMPFGIGPRSCVGTGLGLRLVRAAAVYGAAHEIRVSDAPAKTDPLYAPPPFHVDEG